MLLVTILYFFKVITALNFANYINAWTMSHWMRELHVRQHVLLLKTNTKHANLMYSDAAWPKISLFTSTTVPPIMFICLNKQKNASQVSLKLVLWKGLRASYYLSEMLRLRTNRNLNTLPNEPKTMIWLKENTFVFTFFLRNCKTLISIFCMWFMRLHNELIFIRLWEGFWKGRKETCDRWMLCWRTGENMMFPRR